MARFCEQCGERLEDDENFCHACGTKVFRDEEPPPAPSTPPTPTTSDEKKFLIAGAVTLCVLAGVLSYHYFAQKNSSPPSTSTTSTLKPTPSTTTTATTKPSPPPSTTKPAPLTEADLDLGGLTLGMSRRDVERKLGAAPDVYSDSYYNYGDIEVGFDGDRVKTVACSRAYRTPRGIHVGSSLREVEAAYGMDHDVDSGSKGTVYTYKLATAHLRFVVNNGLVTRIAYYTTQTPAQTPPAPSKPTPPTKSSADDSYNYTCTVTGAGNFRGISRSNVACALYDVTHQKRITGDFGMNHTASGTYYIVATIVGNQTGEPLIVPSIYLIDERGRKFSDDINASSTYNVTIGAETRWDINPGQAYIVYNVFDIPDGVNITELRCEAMNQNLSAIDFNVPFRVVRE